MPSVTHPIATFHLPGLFEFCDLYHAFFALFRTHREYFYDWCEIGSVYGAPADCLWGGGRVGYGENFISEALSLVNTYELSPRLTLSNSLLEPAHLQDFRCNALCDQFARQSKQPCGVIIHSDLLLDYLRQKYPGFYFVSSTTKVLTDYSQLEAELHREVFRYVVPDFRWNKEIALLEKFPMSQRQKIELLCNECCSVYCTQRKACYENVSRKSLGESMPDHICVMPEGRRGYRFSTAMESPAYIGPQDILNTYLPMGITQFKLEGRSLGSAMILEFLLHYLTKPEYQLKVREEIYLDSMLDLF